MHLVRCVELSRIPQSALLEDVLRLFRSPDSSETIPAQSVLRMYLDDFRPTDRWLVTFRTTENARSACDQVSGAVPASTIEGYRELNGLVDDPGRCLRYTGYPPGFGQSDLRQYFKDYRLGTLESPFRLNPSGRVALIEFENRAEAHRAYRDLTGVRQASPTDEFYAQITLLQ
ncbi:hypothetical protein PSACC_03260 [Paramicrosporidium saccamoebae]|uniref:RRM domain-containing protein n=1 Tax=Paramicrosporidium saccamoebae TaxID=1246581 RepID=A0A2H9TH38_9FUNG|nr:hypothetical protein PSACC_03260 [Paramicrosporidium saccamoebae]